MLTLALVRWWMVAVLLLPLVAWGQPAQLINGNRTHAGATNYGLTTGTGAAYVLTLNAAIPGYVDGTCFLLRIHTANTGDATLNVNGKGATPLRKWSSGTAVALAANDLSAGQDVIACYDATTGPRMQVLSLGGGGGGGGALTVSEIDGTPTGSFTGLKFSNGSMTNNGDGTATIVTGVSGGGDASTNTSTSVDGELALFSGVGGKTFKRGTQSGILFGAAGVVSAAVAGTHYVLPGVDINSAHQVTATHLTTPLPVVQGGFGIAPPGDDQLFISNSTTAGAWHAIPSCVDAGGQHLNYDPSTNSLLCGTTGGGGGGGGDASTNASVSVVGELALFASTSGKLLGRATTSGLLKAASGVVSAATPGADYLAPGGNASTATALAANGGNCAAGLAPLGVDALGAAEGCFDVATQTELDTHMTQTNAHSATQANTPSRIVLRDASGNFSAGTITANLNGNVTGNASSATTATTASSFATDPADCTLPQFATAITASGTLGCTQPQLAHLADASSVLTTTSTHRVTNKQAVPRVCTPTVVANAITPALDTCDVIVINALAAGLTINAPTGSGGNPAPGQELIFRFFTTTPRAITWHAIFTESAGIPKLATTTGNGTLSDYVKVAWNERESAYNFLALIPVPATAAGGTGSVQLPMTGVHLPATSPAAIDASLNNRALVFDSTANQCALWDFTLPADYASTPVWRWWYGKQSDTGTGSVRFDVSVMKLLSSATVETDNYDTAVNCTDATSLTTPNQLDSETGIACPLTSMDGAVANNAIKIKVCHNNTDTIAGGNIRLYRARLDYAK